MLGSTAMTAVLLMGMGAVAPKAALAATAGTDSAWLGIYLGNTDQDGAEVLGFVGDATPAERAGLEKGDVIIRFDDQTVANIEELVNAVRDASPGQRVAVDVERAGRVLSFNVALGSRPQNIEMQGLKDFEFKWQGKGKGPKVWMHHGGHAWSEELHDLLEDLDLEAGNINVEVECEDGEGTITIEHDGEVTTHNFDCEEGSHDAHAFMFMQPDGKLKMPKFDFKAPHLDMEQLRELPGMGGKARAFAFARSPRTKIDVAADGSITITVTKGDTQLNLNFDSPEDLRANRPELYEKYQDLMSELD